MTNIDIYTMDADGSNVERLTEHPERDQRGAFSPDGKTVAFVSQRDGDVAVWLIDADGANPRKLVKGREPSFSPDGRRVVFTSSAFHDNDEIYLIDLDGSNRVRLTDNRRKFDWFAAWSPMGDRLAYNSEAFGGQELMVMRTDGRRRPGSPLPRRPTSRSRRGRPTARRWLTLARWATTTTISMS